MNPVPVPDEVWDHPDGLITALRQASNDLNTPAFRAKFATAPANVRILVWVFMHSDTVIVDELGPLQVRFHLRRRHRRSVVHPHPPASTARRRLHRLRAGASDDSGAIDILRTLARDLRTG